MGMTSSRKAAISLLAAIALIDQSGCGEHDNSMLHVAQVVVKPLSPHQNAPASEFPGKFPLQVAVFWTEPQQTDSQSWVRLATTPEGQRSVLLLSHDIDSRASLPRTEEDQKVLII